jgi:hypothetical protein
LEKTPKVNTKKMSILRILINVWTFFSFAYCHGSKDTALSGTLVSEVENQVASFKSITSRSFPQTSSDSLQFETVLQLNHVFGNRLDLSSRSSVIATVSRLSIIIDVPERQIECTTVFGDKRQLIDNEDLFVTTVTNVRIYDYPQYRNNATRLYQDITELLRKAVEDESFQSQLQNAAFAYGADQLESVVASSVTFKGFVVLNTKLQPLLKTNNIYQFPTSFPTSFPTFFSSLFTNLFPNLHLFTNLFSNRSTERFSYSEER